MEVWTVKAEFREKEKLKIWLVNISHNIKKLVQKSKKDNNKVYYIAQGTDYV